MLFFFKELKRILGDALQRKSMFDQLQIKIDCDLPVWA